MNSNQYPISSKTRVIKLSQNDNSGSVKSTKLALLLGRKIKLLDTEQINYLQSNNNYTTIHLISGKKILSSKTMKRFQDRIDSSQFLRVHNSYIINTDQILDFDTSKNILKLNDGSNIPVSRSKKVVLIQHLKSLMV